MLGYVKFLTGSRTMQDQVCCLKVYVYHTYLTQKIVSHFLFDLQLSRNLPPSLLIYLLSNISRVTRAHFAVYQKQLVLRKIFYVIFFVCQLPFLLIILAVIFLYFQWLNFCSIISVCLQRRTNVSHSLFQKVYLFGLFSQYLNQRCLLAPSN